MKGKMKKYLCVLAAVSVMFGGLQIPAAAQAQESGPEAQSGGVTVTTREEFMDALQQQQSPIVVPNSITIGKDTAEDNRMLPVKIPANTIIKGSGDGEICCRSPIQLEGDGVCFQNINLIFESSSALGSVPHREIFLAGHSLTLDNVNTYLEGSGGSLVPLGGSEKELLPTVYAGGFTGSQIGGNASLTVKNSNSETMFAGIYMGHDAGSDNKIPYTGNAKLTIDAPVTIYDRVDTSENASAEIKINGAEGKSVQTKEFYGNASTTMTVEAVSLEKAVIGNIGNVILKNNAYLAPMTGTLQNITLLNGSCLDFNSLKTAVVSGNFSGETSSAALRGILVLNQEGRLEVNGQVSGVTQFQTSSRQFPGILLAGRDYIISKNASAPGQNFVLPQEKINQGYGLAYTDGRWMVTGDTPDIDEIREIKILSAPEKVNIKKIPYEESETDIDIIPDKTIYFGVKWIKEDGSEFSHDEIMAQMYYGLEYVIGIRTDYWKSDSEDILDRTDWGAAIFLGALEEEPGKYYLRAHENAKPGDYTFLFCSEDVGSVPQDAPVRTVRDIKALKDKVLAECSVSLYAEDIDTSGHTHSYQGKVTKAPTCTDVGIRTYTCSCGKSYTERIPLAAHQYTQRRTPATINGDGSVQQVCKVCSAARAVSVISRPQIIWGKTDFSYDGGMKAPSLTVQDSKGKTLNAGTDYQVSYSEGRKNPGVYTAVIEFRGNYSGKVSETFTIRPKKTSLKKVSAKSKGMQATWKKQTAQMDGYQIQYSTSKSFKGKTTKLTAAKKSAVSKKISRLKGKKKYYVRVRTYKTVKVNGEKVKLYSDWSGKKSVKTKR